MGHFLFKAGERGRAKDEYIDGPTDFFVDNNNNIHVFDYVGQKIMVFDEMGKVDKVISTRDHFPYTFGLTNDNRYMYSYLEKLDHGAALAISDEDNKTLKTIIPFKHELRFLKMEIDCLIFPLCQIRFLCIRTVHWKRLFV